MLDQPLLHQVAQAAVASITRADEGVIRLAGVDAVCTRLTQLVAQARVECMILLPALPEVLPAPLEAEAATTARWRGVYQDSLRDDPRTIRHIRWVTERGGTGRTVPTVPMLLFVVDRAVAVLAVDQRREQGDAVELRGSPAGGLHALFEEFWSVATPWAPSGRAGQSLLTEQQREVVRLLAEGLTDEGISRRIGVSLRTVRRIASDLMARLTARSRFEAGVKAAQLGWIE